MQSRKERGERGLPARELGEVFMCRLSYLGISLFLKFFIRRETISSNETSHIFLEAGYIYVIKGAWRCGKTGLSANYTFSLSSGVLNSLWSNQSKWDFRSKAEKEALVLSSKGFKCEKNVVPRVADFSSDSERTSSLRTEPTRKSKPRVGDKRGLGYMI